MMKKITFAEYYNSKEVLKEAINLPPRTSKDYSVTKYCKVPVLLEKDGELIKDFVKLKPKDNVKIIWEYGFDKKISRIIIAESSYLPYWSDVKFKDWIKKTTFRGKDDK